MPSLLEVLKRPSFRSLATAYTVNEVGNWLGDIALAILVYDQTGSPLATAALFIGTRFLPALVAPFFTARLESVDSRLALPVVYVAEAAVFVALAFNASHFLLFSIVALATLDGTLAASGRALTRAAVFSMLGSEGALRSGNAVLNFGFTGAAAVGPATAGLVVGGLGVPAALLLDAVSFLLVAAMLACTRSLPRGVTVSTRWWSHVREGVAYVRERQELRALLTAQGIALIFFTAVTPIEVVFVKDTLSEGDLALGVLLASWGAGMLAGGLVFAIARHRQLAPLLLASTLTVGCAYVGLAAAPTLLAACLLSFLGGAGNGVQLVSLISAIQELTAPRFQARVAGLLESLAAAMPGVGFLLGGAIAALASPRTSYLVAGVGVLLVGLVAAVKLSARGWKLQSVPPMQLGDAEAR